MQCVAYNLVNDHGGHFIRTNVVFTSFGNLNNVSCLFFIYVYFSCLLFFSVHILLW